MQSKNKLDKLECQQQQQVTNVHTQKITQSKSSNKYQKKHPQVGHGITSIEECKLEQTTVLKAPPRRKRIVDENDSPSRLLAQKFEKSKAQQKSSPQGEVLKSNTATNGTQGILDGARGRRLRKLMIEQNCPRYGGMTTMRKKEIVYEADELQEQNEVIEKRCCICLEEMRAKTRPEECSHVFCRACITAWTDTFSNLCPLCKIEIKYLLIYQERPEFEEECQEDSQINEAIYNQVIDKIKVLKPVINEQISDWVQSFADSCYVCNLNDNDPQLLVCDKCNFNICHTYCCGLQTIPEGDWFCQDCLEEMEEQEKRRKLIAERRRKTRLLNQAKKRKILEEEIGGESYQSSSDMSEKQEDITSILKQSDIYNESDEDDHMITQRWRISQQSQEDKQQEVKSRKQVTGSGFAKKKFTSSLQPLKRENIEQKRINSSSLEVLRGQNSK